MIVKEALTKEEEACIRKMLPYLEGMESHIFFYINPSDTNYINRILEGYEYIGVMTSITPKGLTVIRSTVTTYQQALDILESLPLIVRLVPNPY